MQGGRREVALADAGNDRLALLPGASKRRTLPRLGRHQAWARTRQPKIESLTEPKAPGHVGDAVDAATQREVIEIDVARLGDRLDHGKPSVTLTLPAVETAVAQSIVAWTVDSVVGADPALIETGPSAGHIQRDGKRVV